MSQGTAFLEGLQRARRRYRNRFQFIFKVRFEDYNSYVTGLDVVRFDKLVKTPDDKSTLDHVQALHGVKIKEMIEHLVSGV